MRGGKVCKFVALCVAALLLNACANTQRQDFGSSRAYSKEINSRFELDDSYILKFNEFANGTATIRTSNEITASGEKYEPSSFSGAHKTLPFNSIVRVSNLHNGRTNLVRINDRIPINSNEILVLSNAAANELGIEKSALVELEVVAFAFNANESIQAPKVGKNETNLALNAGNLGGGANLNAGNSNALNSQNGTNLNATNSRSGENLGENLSENLNKNSTHLNALNLGSQKQNSVSNLNENGEILVQIGAYKHKENADNLAALWAGYKNYSSFIREEKGLFKVFLRGFDSLDEAHKFIQSPVFCDDFIVLNGKVIAYSKNTCKIRKKGKI